MTAPASLDLNAVVDASIVLPAASASPGNAPAPAAAAPAPAAAQPAAPKAATLAELKAACPGASNDFLVAQLEAGATADAASRAYTASVVKERDELKAKAAAPAPAAAADTKKPGASPVPAGAASAKDSSAAAGEDAVAAFEDAVTAEMDRKKCARHVAHATVCRTRPDLRDAMIAAHNAEHAHKLRGRP